MDDNGGARTARDLDPDAARRLLQATEGVRARARADEQGLAIPLLVLGPLTVGAAVLRFVWEGVARRNAGAADVSPDAGHDMVFSTVVDSYWGTVGALGLVAIGVWFGARSRRRGAGTGPGAWIAAAIGVSVLLAYTGILLEVAPYLALATVIAPSAVIAIALLGIAWRRHDARLAWWALAFGVVTVLASIGFFSNRLYDLLTVLGVPDVMVMTLGSEGDFAAVLVLGIVMAVVGARAQHRPGADDWPHGAGSGASST